MYAYIERDNFALKRQILNSETHLILCFSIAPPQKSTNFLKEKS